MIKLINSVLAVQEPKNFKEIKLEEIQKKCIKIALNISKNKEGCLIVIGNNIKFEEHFPNLFKKINVNIKDPGIDKLLVKLGELDGAIIINNKGKVICFGARILKQKAIKGKGTRHAAAAGVTEENNVMAILGSEEELNVKVFKHGVPIIKIDALTEGITKKVNKVVNFINSPDALVLASSAIAPTILGIALLPGVIVFAGTYYVAKNLIKLTKENKLTKKN